MNLLRKVTQERTARVGVESFSVSVDSEEHVEIVDEVENALVTIFKNARIKEDEYAMSWSAQGGIHFLVVNNNKAREIAALMENKKITVKGVEYRVVLVSSLTTRVDGFKNFEIELFKK